ncbi:MAG: CAP domain-containing protein [Verrucomicrobiales bacterium]|nr:CAP domain-containing protein [Verrucomicrobiota bacterium JB025]
MTAILLCLSCSGMPAFGWSPGLDVVAAADATVGSPVVPLSVDTTDRNDVVSFYHAVYVASEEAAAVMDWTGDVAAGDAGTTGEDFKAHVLRRVNWYRAMSGVPADIEFDEVLNAHSQAAALIMSSEGDLSHTPGATFGTDGWWTEEGEDGANHGNITLGRSGPDAVNGYMEETGSNNNVVGHRRWLLYPRVTKMGTGDIPVSGDYPYTSSGEHWDANCLYVYDPASFRSGIDQFVAWPPNGYVPEETVWARWSLHYSKSSGTTPYFGSATVTMTQVSDGTDVPLTIVHAYNGGDLYGDPAIVWEPDWSGFGGSPPLESEFEVTVSGISPGTSGASASYTYHVTVINPDSITDAVVPVGTTTPPETGATYGFTPVSGVGADGYEVGVAAKTVATWTEGAEESPEPEILDGTNAGYELRVNLSPAYGSAGNYAGSRVFHLTILSYSDMEDTFEIDRDIIPSATSVLEFYELFRWVTTTTRLGAEVSTDGGGSWTEVWGKNGNGATNSNGWVTSWTRREVSLAAYEGMPIRVRFRLSATGGAYTYTGNNFGVFVDEVSVSDGLELGSQIITALSGRASSFVLDDETAGAALEAGDEYVVRLRTVLGGKTFGFGDPLEVTVADLEPGFATWMNAHHFDVAPAGPLDDPDGDRIASLVEYALGTDPGAADSAVPGLSSEDGQLVYSIDPSTLGYEVGSVRYGAEVSSDMVDWTAVPDTGEGSVHRYALPMDRSSNFMRWAISADE